MGLLQFLGLKRKKILESDSVKYIGGTERHIWRVRGVKGYVALKMNMLSINKGKPIADILEELVNQADDTIQDEKADRKVKRLLKKRLNQRYPEKE